MQRLAYFAIPGDAEFLRDDDAPQLLLELLASEVAAQRFKGSLDPPDASVATARAATVRLTCHNCHSSN